MAGQLEPTDLSPNTTYTLLPMILYRKHKVFPDNLASSGEKLPDIAACDD